MKKNWLPTLVIGIGITGCGGSSTDPSNSGGAGGTLDATGGFSTGGSAAEGSGIGGSSSGGEASGGAGSGGGSSTGGPSTGGSDATGGSGTGGDTASDDVRPSKGCTVADGESTLTAGGSSVMGGVATSTRLTITSNGTARDYIVDIPADYDPTHPYRLIFSWHQAYGSANGNAVGQYPANNGPNFNAENYAFFGLRREANAANDPVIFVAPQGIGNFPWDFTRDSALFDNLLTHINENLCIDESRVFTTGFSFGAMMSYSLSITRQTKLRGAVTMGAANYNLPGQPTDSGGVPIAYLGITGMSDGTTPWVNSDAQKRGGKYCALTHAENAGCTIPGNIETATNGSKNHVCYEFEGCDADYPVKVCTFDGAHTPSSVSDGMSGGDDGMNAFTPPLAWEFISQF